MGPPLVLLALSLALQGEAAVEPKADAPVRPIDTNVFAFSIEPERVVLGETASAVVTVRAQRADGTPLDVADPRLAASLGTLGDVVRTGPGTWTCSYTPPAPGPPQMAVIVAAIDAGASDAVGFTALPLWGKGETVVRTEPGSVVRVLAGGAEFGPVKADAKGIARVPLALRPGVQTATTISLDEANNSTEQKLDLRVPPFNRVALLPLDEATVSDGTGFARLVALTVDETGAPTLAGKLTLRASTGTVVVRRTLAPGLRELVLAPAKTTDATATVEASLDRQKASRATAEISLVAGRAAGARITLSRESVSESDADRVVAVGFQLVDAADRPVPPQGAGVFVDLGRLATLTRDPDGTRHVTWVIPERSGLESATLTVHLPSGVVLGSKVVKLTPAERKPAVPDVPKPPPRARPGLLLGGGLLVGTNYGALVSAGAEVSALGRVSVLDAPLYVGGSIGALPSWVRPANIEEHRAFPLFAELLWRPEVGAGMFDFMAGTPIDLLLGASAGVVLSDTVARAGGPHLVEPAIAGQAVVGFGFNVGPGALDVYARFGSAVYPFGGGSESIIGLPLGASLVVGYRFGLF